MRLGWSHGDQEIFSIPEMIELFKIEDVNSKASRLDPTELNWINSHYLKTDAPEDIAKHLQWHMEHAGYDLTNGPALADVVIALRDRVDTLKQMAERAAVWYQPLTNYDEAAVAKQFVPAALLPMQTVRAELANLSEWSPSAIHGAMQSTGEKLGVGLGKIGPALRVAITGTQQSPSIDHTVFLAGQVEALKRIDAALTMLAKLA